MNVRRAQNPFGRLAAWAVCAGLAGCALGPHFERPASPPAAGYLPHAEAAAEPASGATPASPVQPWWQAWQSERLDALVAQARSRNMSLDSASATLRQSEQNLRAGQGLYLPEIDANLDLSRQRLSIYRTGGVIEPSTLFNLYTLGATISYSLDLFGTRSRTVEALGAQVDTQRYALAAADLTVTANVVNAALAYAAYQREQQLVRRMVELQADQLHLSEVQWRNGLVAESAVMTQRQALAQAQAVQESLDQRLAQARHTLSLLLGQAGAEELPPLPEWDELRRPAAPVSVLPSELARRRPDVLQAEAQMHLASANLGVASAVMWPSVSLNASGGSTALDFSKLGEAQSRFWSGGASATVVLYKGGAQSAQRQAAQEALHATEADYRQVVLTALRQVADALTARQHDAQAAQAQWRDAEAAERSWALARVNAAAGLLNRQQLQAAEWSYLQAQWNAVDAQAQLYQDEVALYAALGGEGWGATGASTPMASDAAAATKESP